VSIALDFNPISSAITSASAPDDGADVAEYRSPQLPGQLLEKLVPEREPQFHLARLGGDLAEAVCSEVLYLVAPMTTTSVA
jgi:hypothetical protein